MSDVHTIVDHLRLEYEGPMNVEEFFSTVERHLKERAYQKSEPHTFEAHNKDGISIDWYINPWKKISSEQRFIIKVDAQFRKLKKMKVPQKIGPPLEIFTGKVMIWFDGVLEHDYEHRWEERPMFQFIRWVFDRFFYLAYTERFEQRLTSDVHKLYRLVEKYFNIQTTLHHTVHLPRL